jgi:hypothetical protein
VTLNGTTRVTLPEGPALVKDVRVSGCPAPAHQQSRPASAR